MEAQAEDWELASGVWRRGGGEAAWLPLARADGSVLSDRLSPTERLSIVAAAMTASGTTGIVLQFPPDFVFSPDTGERLTPPALSASRPWIPPCGPQPVRGGSIQGSEARGLHQTAFDITVSERTRTTLTSRRSATDDPDRSMPAPPPGQYEFAVGRFGADFDIILAIEPDKGALFVWLHAGKRWEPLSHDTGGSLADSSVRAEHWKAEIIQEGENTLLFLPTSAGLAIIRPRCPALNFTVSYLGSGTAVGAPVMWGGEVWAPLRDSDGRLAVIAVSTASHQSRSHPCSTPLPEVTFGAPVCDPQQVIWPGQDGQLVVRKGPDGGALCTWVPWPADVRPAFSFGCPYLSATGRFWQLCWSQRDESYVYVQLGRAGPEVMPTISPAICTGRRSYKMATRMKGDPWLDPADTNDANSNDVVIPILESTRHGAVLGLVVEAEGGVSALLESKERHRAVAQLQSDKGADVRFQTLIVSMPWRTRVFISDGCLWTYHPDLHAISGIELEV